MYGFHVGIASLTNIALEWCLFLISMTFMIKTKDIFFLFKHHPSNMILAIPLLTVLLPTVISFPLYVPLALLIPHIVYLILFTIPILIDWKVILKKN